ncbi:MAG: hypothetical protein K8J08_16380 [Thermoanaerobaculia bacterium]|nr:hypothetical protein [Thermoanaerobaculia bacterium]
MTKKNGSLADSPKEETIVELVRWMKDNGVATNETLIEVLNERPTNGSVELLVDYSKQRVVGARGPVRRVFGVEFDEVRGKSPFDLIAPSEHEGVRGLVKNRVERSGPSLRKVYRLDDGTLFDAITSGHREQGSIWAVRVVPVAV